MRYYLLLSLVILSLLPGCIPPKPNVATPQTREFEQPRVENTGSGYKQQPPKPVVYPEPFPVTEEEKQGVVSMQTPGLTPSMAYIKDRIFSYGMKLEKWKKLDEKSLDVEMQKKDADQMVQCFKDLQRVLGGYQRMREEMLQQNELSSAEPISGERFLELQKMDIQFLESECGRILGDTENKSAGWYTREETADLSQLETLIDRYSVNNEYEEVVQVWLQIPASQIDRIDLKTKLAYGNALMYLHQEEKAAQVYQGIVDQMSASKEQATDIISLRKVLADLYTAAGQYGKAEVQYGKISMDYVNLGSIDEWSKLQMFILERSGEGSPELTEYSSLLRNYLGFIPEQDGYKVVWQADKFLENYPYTAVSSNVDVIKSDTQRKADEWFDNFMAGIDALAAEKKYEEGLELLETIPSDIISGEKQIELKEKGEELLLDEQVSRETEKMARIQELDRQMNSGMLLAESGEYEKAIGIFIGLLDTEYSTRASKKIEEISLTAAKADQKRAAFMYRRFKSTDAVDAKVKLLKDCREILKNILVKYPEVEISDSIVRQIGIVETRMNEIDPGLLPEILKQEEAQQNKGTEVNNLLPLTEDDPFQSEMEIQEGTVIQ